LTSGRLNHNLFQGFDLQKNSLGIVYSPKSTKLDKARTWDLAICWVLLQFKNTLS